MSKILNTAGQEDLFSFVRRNKNYFTGCCQCGSVWPAEKSNRSDNDYADFQLILFAASQLNDAGLSVESIRDKLGMNLGGMCEDCFVQEVRNSQRKEGLKACFSTSSFRADSNNCQICKFSNFCGRSRKPDTKKEDCPFDLNFFRNIPVETVQTHQ